MNQGRRIELARASQVVAAELRERILFGELGRRDRLPPAAEFAQELGISYHHLREALRLLEQDGLIQVRGGHYGGIFLTLPDADVLARTFEGILARKGTLLADVIAARRIVEPAAAELAARHATEDDLAALDAILARHGTNEDLVAGQGALNSEFHLAVVDASHNKTLILLMRSIARLVEAADRAGARMTTVEITSRPELRDRTARAHRSIVKAVRERDVERVGALMRRHLGDYEQWFRMTGLDPAHHTVADILRLAATDSSVQRFPRALAPPTSPTANERSA
jgi:DNA-binding FadR family transcriptional regulator